jgi:hypothetical protein
VSAARAKLARDLGTTMNQIEKQIDVLESQAFRMKIDVSQLQSRDGSYPIIPLLTAKANVQLAIVLMDKVTS